MSMHNRKHRLDWHPNVLHFVGICILVVFSVGAVTVVEAAAPATEVGIDEAITAYRGAPTPAPAQTPAPTAGASPNASVAQPSEPAPADHPAPPAPRAERPGDPRPAPEEPAAPTAFSPPPSGVYRYRVSGGESVNMPGASRRYPEESFATVRHRGGCRWELEHPVAEEHVDRRVYCSQPGALLFVEGETRVAFFGQSDGSTVVCDPPSVVVRLGDAPGTTHRSTCSGDGTTVDERLTYVGREDVAVGGVRVPAHHVRMEATVSGRAEGTSEARLWVHADTGLVLRAERRTDTTQQAFGSRVRYEEEATFELLDLAPRT